MYYGDAPVGRRGPRKQKKEAADGQSTASGSTGFTKKITTTPQLYRKQTGIAPYPNGQYCLSTGNESLDAVLGGGLPVGSITVLYEDSHSQLYSHFLKTYMAEGIVNSHQCVVIDSADSFRDKEHWLKFLPNVIKTKAKEEEAKSNAAHGDMEGVD